MNESFWDMCYGTHCVDFRVGLVDGPDWAPEPWNAPNQFTGGFYDYNVQVSAWGLKYPGNSRIDLYYGDSGWGYYDTQSFGSKWNGFDFIFMAYPGYPETNVGGAIYDNALNQGFWIGEPPAFDKILFGWRGVLEDGTTFDCIQQYHDDDNCDVVLTPEPSISLMVVTGLLFTLLFNRWRRRR